MRKCESNKHIWTFEGETNKSFFEGKHLVSNIFKCKICGWLKLVSRRTNHTKFIEMIKEEVNK